MESVWRLCRCLASNRSHDPDEYACRNLGLIFNAKIVKTDAFSLFGNHPSD
jgi:hypothetical protein